jgi:hypothetical protein
MVMAPIPLLSGRKVDDGQSVRVTVPAASVIEQGTYTVVQGFHGMNVSKPKVQTLVDEDIILQTDGATYESSQLNPGDAFNARGALIYFDPAFNWLTTTAASYPLPVGKLVLPLDANGVIWFRQLPQWNA